MVSFIHSLSTRKQQQQFILIEPIQWENIRQLCKKNLEKANTLLDIGFVLLGKY